MVKGHNNWIRPIECGGRSQTMDPRGPGGVHLGQSPQCQSYSLKLSASFNRALSIVEQT